MSQTLAEKHQMLSVDEMMQKACQVVKNRRSGMSSPAWITGDGMFVFAAFQTEKGIFWRWQLSEKSPEYLRQSISSLPAGALPQKFASRKEGADMLYSLFSGVLAQNATKPDPAFRKLALSCWRFSGTPLQVRGHSGKWRIYFSGQSNNFAKAWYKEHAKELQAGSFATKREAIKATIDFFAQCNMELLQQAATDSAYVYQYQTEYYSTFYGWLTHDLKLPQKETEAQIEAQLQDLLNV